MIISYPSRLFRREEAAEGRVWRFAFFPKRIGKQKIAWLEWHAVNKFDLAGPTRHPRRTRVYRFESGDGHG